MPELVTGIHSGSSIGRAAVSKIAGWGFESLPVCHWRGQCTPKYLRHTINGWSALLASGVSQCVMRVAVSRPAHEPTVKTMSLSQRRHHAERMKRKLRRKEKAAPYWTSDGEPDNRSAGLYANHGCNCSCWMCGNPRRKQGKKTIQELKSDQDYQVEQAQPEVAPTK